MNIGSTLLNGQGVFRFWNEDGYEVYEIKEESDAYYIYIRSQVNAFECPYCGEGAHHFHSTYTRTIQDTPIHNKQVFIIIETHKLFCYNQDCINDTFVENIPYAERSQVRAYALNALIFGVSMFLSSNTASFVLALLGVKISHDTIQRMYNRLDFVDNPDVEAVGIDDVAIHKGQTYATAIYDLETKQMIALLDGRDGETLKDWLKEHKKISLVARDRASSYATAINEILPKCTQVADRFHLVQNIIERLRDIFKVEMPAMIFIKDSEILDKEPKKIDVMDDVDEQTLNSLDYDSSEPLDSDGIPIKYDNKNRNLSRPQYQRQAQGRKEKQYFIREIQKYWKNLDKKRIATVAKEYNIANLTAKKYINMTEEDINKLDQPQNYKKRKTVMDDYLNIIYKMISDNIECNIVYSYVKYKGYSGSDSTLLNYIETISKNNFPNQENNNYSVGWYMKHARKYPDDVIVIKRNELLKYILTKNPKIQKNEVITKHFELIKTKYPIVTEVQTIYDDFHATIMGDDVGALDKFLETYKDTKIKGFCNGIKKDITPVKNAISLDISSGFVEGNNNKFKLIKRILYGRANLVNLSKKCLLVFSSKMKGFDLNKLSKLSSIKL